MSTMLHKNIRILTVPEEFAPVEKLRGGGHSAATLYPLSIRKAKPTNANSSARIVIRLRNDLLAQLNWKEGDHVYIGVSLGQRRALLRKSADEHHYKLSFATDKGGSAFVQISVRDEPTRALMPVNGHEEYYPNPDVDPTNGCLFFNLDA